MNLPQVLQFMYPTADLLTDIKMRDVGNGPEIYEWNLADIAQPTNEEIAMAMITYDLAFRQKQVMDIRKISYPTWNQQLDMQYNDSINNTTTWKDAIAAVKVANPRPTE